MNNTDTFNQWLKDKQKKENDMKKVKQKKEFKKGDVIKCVELSQGKIPRDCFEFLLTYKRFKVVDVNEKMNIYLGYNLLENGNPYYFSPNRFELIDGTAPLKDLNTDENVDDEGEQKSKKTMTGKDFLMSYFDRPVVGLDVDLEDDLPDDGMFDEAEPPSDGLEY